MMLLDEFGRPIHRQSGFITPEWVRRETIRLFKSDLDAYKRCADDLRIAELYESAGVRREVSGSRVGNTVHARTPSRFKDSQ